MVGDWKMELYWRLPINRIHYEFLEITTRYVASQGTNGPNAQADHMQEIGFLDPYLIAFNVSCKRRFEALALAVMPSA